ncbi:hypothetical protein RB600_001636 [Gaeumannomyces tritici]
MSPNIFDWLDSVNAQAANAQAANADPPPSRKRDRVDDHNGSLLTPEAELAVHGGTLSSEGLVQVEPCTTATILAEYYRRPLSSSRKIDFVMVLDLVSPTTLSSGRAASDAIDRIREGLPGCSINHTDFEPLEQCPVGLSIVTKRGDGKSREATAQLGV